MTNRIEFIRKKLDQLGYSLQERRFTTEDGSTLWVISCRQNKQLFCVEGSTQSEAWDLAWNLKGQIQNNNAEEPSMILPFSSVVDKEITKTCENRTVQSTLRLKYSACAPGRLGGTCMPIKLL